MRAVSQELNAPTKYLGMPAAGYETGMHTGPDNRVLITVLCEVRRITAVAKEYSAVLSESSRIYPAGCMDGWYDLIETSLIPQRAVSRKLYLFPQKQRAYQMVIAGKGPLLETLYPFRIAISGPS